MNATLAYMADQQATGEDAAVEFLTKHSDVWTSWVTADAAKRSRLALNTGPNQGFRLPVMLAGVNH